MNLIVSFSGGETSAYMAQYLNKNFKKLGFSKIFIIFANTGQEHEKTLEFVNKCDKYFNLNVIYLEALIDPRLGVGTSYEVKNSNSITKNFDYEFKQTPFEKMIMKYGIPNISFPHCTRELKIIPIQKYIKKNISKNDYKIAIGIRVDEFDRINKDYKKMNLIYPLISNKMNPTRKVDINNYWKKMPFRLDIPSYMGNCITCFKKSDKSLLGVFRQNIDYFNFNKNMESAYSNNKGMTRVFFRKNRDTNNLLKSLELYQDNVKINDTNTSYFNPKEIDKYIEEYESCDIFSGCGD